MDELIKEEKSPIKQALTGRPMIIAWVAMLIFSLHSATHMVGAGDTWVAMACGRHFVNHGVDTIEPFSANSHKAGPTVGSMKKFAKDLRVSAQGEKGISASLKRWYAKKAENYENWSDSSKRAAHKWHPTGWINQNWLTHVIFYWLTHLSSVADADTYSYNSLVYGKFALYILVTICVYYMGKVLGANPALSAVLACFAIFVGRSYFDIRPAGFSNLMVALFLLSLILATHRNILYIWFIVPISILWCNLHGGYIYIFIMMAAYLGLSFVTCFSKKIFVNIGPRGMCHAIAASGAAFLATIIFNPFHLTNLTHTFVISVSEHAERWRAVNEWHPAFEWGNPVGTSYPFLVMYALSIILAAFWIFGRFLKPRLVKSSAKQIQRQKEGLEVASKIFGVLAFVSLFWVALISFSFVDLDLAGFVIPVIFAIIVLLSVYKNVHFIHIASFLGILALGLAREKLSFQGRYIYPFLILPAYISLHFIASKLSEKIKFKTGNILFVTASALAAIVVMFVFFNPFALKDAEWSLMSLVKIAKPWHPAYSNNARPSYIWLPIGLYVVNFMALCFGMVCNAVQDLSEGSEGEVGSVNGKKTYTPPKIDLAIIVIAALTVYMAIRSRRFITLAGIAACPVIALFIDQIIRALGAVKNYCKKNAFVVSPMPVQLQNKIIFAGIIATVFFGSYWGMKFKRVYLDFWPTDKKLNSVFMRMTASDFKPFWAMQFIKENNFKGNMFNYWTEGGFIAYGQEPDPKTGKTPLQLFMDGRAQAAYEQTAYNTWQSILYGGPHVQSAKARKKRPNYTEVGKWIGNELGKRNVWTIMMPSGHFNSNFVLGLERNRDYRIVFLNDKQKIYVNIRTEQGMKLFNGVNTGETKFPDKYSEHLTKGHNLLLFSNNAEDKKIGFEHSMKALEIGPSRMSMQLFLTFGRFKQLAPKVDEIAKEFFDDFIENKKQYSREDGYFHRVVAVVNAINYLKMRENGQNNTEKIEYYNEIIRELNNEQKILLDSKRW